MGWEPGKPSQNEDEYFAKRDAEWMRERRAQLDREAATAQKVANARKCPVCGTPLIEREFRNVKLDSCPNCKGAWFDGGELEMVILLKRGDQMRIVDGLTE